MNQMLVGVMSVIAGVITLVVGIILAPIVIDNLTTALTNASIGSYTGTVGIGGLIPMLYFVGLIGVTITMIGGGGFLASRTFRGG